MARRTTSVKRSRPNNSWFSVISSTWVTIPAASKVLLGSLAPSNQNIDETQLRVIGSVAIASDQSGANEFQIGSVGLIVVSAVAVTAGIASIPGPSTDGDDDGWFCHQQFAMFGQQSSDSLQSVRIPFESKGRRIVQDGEAIAIVAENIHATNGLILNLQFRLLSRVTGT